VTALGPRSLEQVSKGKLEVGAGHAGHIVRPLTAHDVGIDGEIEFCFRGTPTGARLAYQLRAGASYLSSMTDAEFRVRVDSRHLRYWCCVNLPVLLIYYHPESDELVWTDVKSWLLESGFDPTTQETVVVPILRINRLPGQCTDQWRRILSLAAATQRQIEEVMINRIRELSLFTDPRYVRGVFAFTAERIVVAEAFDSSEWQMIQVPESLAPPVELTTTLITVASLCGQSTGAFVTQLGWPEVPFDTLINDTVPLEMVLLYGTFHASVAPRRFGLHARVMGSTSFLAVDAQGTRRTNRLDVPS